MSGRRRCAAAGRRAELRVEPLRVGAYEVVLRVDNRRGARGLDRARGARALADLDASVAARARRALRLAARAPAARTSTPFRCSPRRATTRSLGAAIVLPDHPQLAPESRGSLFDNTEIEEALLLHVHALSDAEREQIDGRTRRCARWSTGRSQRRRRTSSRCTALTRARAGRRERDARVADAAGPPPGLRRSDAGRGAGARRRRHVPARRQGRAPARRRRRPARPACSTGARATIERIFIDYDGKAHLGVTIDDDPGQHLMRETGRYLFFFAPEVELVRAMRR